MDSQSNAPRLLTKAEAAAYCRTSIRCFDRWRRHKMLPDYVPGMFKFDRFAIDDALDALSKRMPHGNPVTETDPIEEWKKKRDDRKRKN